MVQETKEDTIDRKFSLLFLIARGGSERERALFSFLSFFFSLFLGLRLNSIPREEEKEGTKRKRGTLFFSPRISGHPSLPRTWLSPCKFSHRLFRGSLPFLPSLLSSLFLFLSSSAFPLPVPAATVTMEYILWFGFCQINTSVHTLENRPGRVQYL